MTPESTSTVTTTHQNRNQHPKEGIDIVSPQLDHPLLCQSYLTTTEAARYLRRSVSWLLRCGQIPYVRGHPNVYSIKDLDEWFERNKWVPKD